MLATWANFLSSRHCCFWANSLYQPNQPHSSSRQWFLTELECWSESSTYCSLKPGKRDFGEVLWFCDLTSLASSQGYPDDAMPLFQQLVILKNETSIAPKACFSTKIHYELLPWRDLFNLSEAFSWLNISLFIHHYYFSKEEIVLLIWQRQS